jgi:3-(3-hydroxy-phenyl)propionate hydroxylase
MAEDIYDVVIVGLGPSGATAAALLGQAGLKVYVCDRSHDVYDKPRAIALDHEILRIFQQLGITEAIERYYEPFTDSCYFGVEGQMIKRMTMVGKPYPQAHLPSVVFTQPLVEKVLRSTVANLANVTVELGMALESLHQKEHLVSLGLKGDQGEDKMVNARYVIGCDGASSTVRGLVGLSLEDLGFDEPWLVIDVLVNEQGIAKLPKTSAQYCEPERPCTFVIGPNNHRRWEISLANTEDPIKAATPENAWRYLKRWITPEDGELWRQASYRFHALVAENWRSGRVFIAGDASHQQPPFLGQGMCQGVRDVNNLTWKLEAVLKGTVRGHAAENLLDSYGFERKEHVKKLTTAIKSVGATICERNIEKARLRDARLLTEQGGVVQPTPRQDIIPRLTTGMITQTPGAGSLFPQPWLWLNGIKQRMDDVVGTKWRLITISKEFSQADPRLVNKIGIRTLSLNDALVESDDLLANWLNQHAAIAAIIRPDNYVYATAANQQCLEKLQDELFDILDKS